MAAAGFPVSATIDRTSRHPIVTVSFSDNTVQKEIVFGGCFMAPADDARDAKNLIAALAVNPALSITEKTKAVITARPGAFRLHV